jgi:hypothetical protein
VFKPIKDGINNFINGLSSKINSMFGESGFSTENSSNLIESLFPSNFMLILGILFMTVDAIFLILSAFTAGFAFLLMKIVGFIIPIIIMAILGYNQDGNDPVSNFIKYFLDKFLDPFITNDNQSRSSKSTLDEASSQSSIFFVIVDVLLVITAILWPELGKKTSFAINSICEEKIVNGYNLLKVKKLEKNMPKTQQSQKSNKISNTLVIALIGLILSSALLTMCVANYNNLILLGVLTTLSVITNIISWYSWAKHGCPMDTPKELIVFSLILIDTMNNLIGVGLLLAALKYKR